MAGLQVFCGVGEGGAAATIGGNAKEAIGAVEKEGMIEGNTLPVTDEICLWYFYQLSIS